MTLIRFHRPDGSLDREVEADEGANLLDVAQEAGQPLEGTCGKQMSCSTCHVVLDPDSFARSGAPSEDEDYLLDLAFDAQPTSRLACQVAVSGGEMMVRMP
ncbi:ferredoxin family 2Fe-2S iron-sulfur cluster binding protein [Sphingomonas swuensis]|uniref:Ferredoxin family 2Fe-2S iron-sulfur cluster binding protein n=1 Tax=Sphingomonas swuensis TaxID=977800 RepID=A0ABP7STM1_9SPHN